MVFVPEQKEPWASIQTKKCDALLLHVNGPAGQVPLGKIADIGHEPIVKMVDAEKEIVKLTFNSIEQLQTGELESFLSEHLEQLTSAAK